jgi:sorbitol-specific phosphotransferase system component IIC
MGSTPIFKMFMLCKGMMLVAFGMLMRVKRKPAGMEEQGCSPHEVQGKYTNIFLRERPPIRYYLASMRME